jgi:hypothetical protein
MTFDLANGLTLFYNATQNVLLCTAVTHLVGWAVDV